MIHLLKLIPEANRDLVAMTCRFNPWQSKLVEVANCVTLGKNNKPVSYDLPTFAFQQWLSILDHPSEWVGDHRYEASRAVDELINLLHHNRKIKADPNAMLSNGRTVMDVLTAENRYQLWKQVSENIPNLAILAFEKGALASSDAAKAMILPVYTDLNPSLIDDDSEQLIAMIDQQFLDAETNAVATQAQARRL
jgi:hypothetical protein